MRQAIEGRDDGAASIERDGVVYRRVALTPKTVMTLSGAVTYTRQLSLPGTGPALEI